MEVVAGKDQSLQADERTAAFTTGLNIKSQLHWLTVIFLPKRSPNLNHRDEGEQKFEEGCMCKP